MRANLKQEIIGPSEENNGNEIISLSSSSGEFSGLCFNDSDYECYMELNPKKKQKIDTVLPVGFLDPLRPEERLALQKHTVRPFPPLVNCPTNFGGIDSRVPLSISVKENMVDSVPKELAVVKGKEREKALVPLSVIQNCKQFWKAGDYEECVGGGSSQTADMDRVRVHPKFLHSNATSHKWALGAFAELLDNALDEVCNGATYVNVDVLENIKDNSKILLVEDNGGGMTPDKMRQCMSLGYSAKSKIPNTIGQYGNGFKTSTMRLGADVIVFSRCQGKDGRSTTQSIGMLSYTFLRRTGKEDIVVPMIDYEKIGETWNKLLKSSSECWQRNLETILQWSPYESEEDLLQQFKFLKDQGTRIIIYNIWEDDQGSLELDFDTDPQDIQIRGASRDEKNIKMADLYPTCRHFLTYRHSLRNYASILYLRLPPGFRIILRGRIVDHHNIVDDLMEIKEITYKPAACTEAASKDPNMVAVVTLGFFKHAKVHLDVQGFNVYHKNRLIKPFWRVWNAAGSDGRGVIGVLEANFVEPAHDKQGFERTIVLSRLEAKLVAVQKSYWSSNCEAIGYAPRRHSKKSISPEKVATTIDENKSKSPEKVATTIDENKSKSPEKVATTIDDNKSKSPEKVATTIDENISKVKSKLNGNTPNYGAFEENLAVRNNYESIAVTSSRTVRTTQSEEEARNCSNFYPSGGKPQTQCESEQTVRNVKTEEIVRDGSVPFPSITDMVIKLTEQNQCLREGMKNVQQKLQYEKVKNKSLQNQLQIMKEKLEKMDGEQEVFVISFSEERSRRELEEENLRKSLKDASETIQELLKKVKLLEFRNVTAARD